MREEFVLDERLGIHVPELSMEWEDYSETDRAAMLAEWEEIRGRIPDRIKSLERVIMEKQRQLDHEDDFPASCKLNWEIAEIASTINDLHIWYRINQDVAAHAAHH